MRLDAGFGAVDRTLLHTVAKHRAMLGPNAPEIFISSSIRHPNRASEVALPRSMDG